MKFVFFGTSRFSGIVLEKLIEFGLRPAAVVCNPDKPVGRKKALLSPPTKLIARRHEIEVYQPPKLDINEWRNKIGKVDFMVVAAYGKIIPAGILAEAESGVIGAHPSLLPRFRGPSPIQSVILNGDAKTGVTLFLVDERLDHGPVLESADFVIPPFIAYKDLEEELALLGADLLNKVIPLWLKGVVKAHAQNESEATFTKKIVTEDGFVDLNNTPAVIIERKMRALNPEPGVYTFMDLPIVRSSLAGGGKRVKLLEGKFQDGKLIITKMQPEGQKTRSVKIII